MELNQLQQLVVIADENALFRAAKKRKRDWQERMEILLSQREDNVQQRRQELLALVND